MVWSNGLMQFKKKQDLYLHGPRKRLPKTKCIPAIVIVTNVALLIVALI